ncbi:MAG: ParB/RepB/Spo0J family partition protein [Planctomycetes bacterium]|nr:ParB/RepB/Spo0J family partition protein [Planctomycetota bacterium]MCB9891302.1 ParB/RepB/Spo0J family partition protein [Planctomycetota bacterium]MCB9919439.1 ParB/RepB/Spo0J family partition protein [Planctomycetota bacterium]
MAGRRLGRGLQFLLSDRSDGERLPDTEEATRVGDGDPSDRAPEAVAADTAGTSTPAREDGPTSSLELDVDRLVANPHQPRTTFDEAELEALATSIRTSGVLQPILVRPRGDHFEIVAGERRFRAAKRAGLTRIPVLVRAVDDVELRLFALVENLQRSDLDPIEKARSFRDIKTATGWTHNRIADAVGMDRSHVTNFLRLLELEVPIQKALREGRLTMGHARALLAIPADRRLELLGRIEREQLSVRDVERLGRDPAEDEPATAAEPQRKTAKRAQPAWAKEMEQHLIEALGCRVAVEARGKRGRIVLDVGTRSEFDRVYELLLSTLPGSSD